MPLKAIYLISDSTGNLGERMILALTSQYPKNSFTFRVFSFVRNENEVRRLLENFDNDRSIVFHTVLSADLKTFIKNSCRQNGIPEFDLTGPAMDFLEKVSGITPHYDPDRLHEINTDYEKRIEALNFAVEHDDGVGLSSLHEADIVLLGVSRTSKTPTSIFLAGKGYKVGNIPIVGNVDYSEHITRLKNKKIVGLIIDAQKLQDIRLRRAAEEKIPGQDYTDLDAIRQELKTARQIFLTLQCPVIDVTNRAIEETAALILKNLGLR